MIAPGRAAGRARARRRAAHPGQRVHERLRLPREPRAGRRPGGARRLSSGQVPQRLARQGERGQRAQRRWSSSSPTGGGSAVVQIAGLVARRIVCFVAEGALLRTGERFGLIRFGSRLDVYLPDGVAPLVARRPGGGGRRDGDRRPRLGRAGAHRRGPLMGEDARRAAAAAAAGAEPRHHPRPLRRADGAALRLRRTVRGGRGADRLRGGARRLRRAARPQARRRQPRSGPSSTRSPTSSTSGWRRPSSSTSWRSAARPTSAGPRRWSSRSAPACGSRASTSAATCRSPGARTSSGCRRRPARCSACCRPSSDLRRHRRRRRAALAGGALAGARSAC